MLLHALYHKNKTYHLYWVSVPRHIFTFSTVESDVSYNTWSNIVSHALTGTLSQREDIRLNFVGT